jgi:hypothetical protein
MFGVPELEEFRDLDEFAELGLGSDVEYFGMNECAGKIDASVEFLFVLRADTVIISDLLY